MNTISCKTREEDHADSKLDAHLSAPADCFHVDGLSRHRACMEWVHSERPTA